MKVRVIFKNHRTMEIVKTIDMNAKTELEIFQYIFDEERKNKSLYGYFER